MRAPVDKTQSYQEHQGSDTCRRFDGLSVFINAKDIDRLNSRAIISYDSGW